MIKNAYAAALTNAMGDDITLRDIDRALEYSYEHIRSTVAGENISFKREFNDAICKFLKLDADKMWDIAQGLKIEQKFGSRAKVVAPADDRMKKIWCDLTPNQRQQLFRIAAGMAEQNKALAELELVS